MFLKKDLLQNLKVVSQVMEGNLEQTEEKKQIQNEEIKPIEVGIKTKILGMVLLFFTAFWTYIGFYDFLTLGIDLTSFQLPLYIFSYIVVIALFIINKRGIYHKLIASCGIILLAFYVFMLVISLLF
jgi:hypothetical protein